MVQMEVPFAFTKRGVMNDSLEGDYLVLSRRNSSHQSFIEFDLLHWFTSTSTRILSRTASFQEQPVFKNSQFSRTSSFSTPGC